MTTKTSPRWLNRDTKTNDGNSRSLFTHYRHGVFAAFSLALCAFVVLSTEFHGSIKAAELKSAFQNPSPKSGTVTLWWLNGTLTEEEIRKQMLAMRDQCGFSGVAPLTQKQRRPSTSPPYLSDEYFEMYGHILETAKDLGMSVVFYDDCDFPSGTAGGQMRERYPDDLVKVLRRTEKTIEGPATAKLPIKIGKVMSVVATNLDSKQSRGITKEVTVNQQGNELSWEAPAGNWRLQAFVCSDGGRHFVDYLNPESVEKFIGLTYDKFADRYPEHFGTTVKMTFFDDISLSDVHNDQTWANDFNEKFVDTYGESPELLYPALWEDIGPDTQSARARLFSVRNTMFANGYPKVVQQWCDKRNMHASGHPNAAYRPNPLETAGDSMLFYKHQDFILTDYIHFLHHGVDGFKVPASAAYNFDKSTLVLEIYGNFHPKRQRGLPNDGEMLYRAGMEAYARGINYLLPHGTWWDPERVAIPPEISWRNPDMAAELPTYNRWAARCETLLRGGRHVADIGVLYPIHDLAARYNFSDYQNSRNGRIVPEGSDYYDLLGVLTKQVRQDYTLLHPEVIDEKCTVEGRQFVLNNKVNWERYQVIILPSCQTISLANLKKIRHFYDNGGAVIATTCLPEKSVLPGQDEEVQRIIEEMFAEEGRGVFIPEMNADSMKEALSQFNISWDIAIDQVKEMPKASKPGPKVPDQDDLDFAFNYIHKVKDGVDCYFFSNPTARAVTAQLTISSTKSPALWNPHTGTIEAVKYERKDSSVILNLQLPPIQSRFLIFAADKKDEDSRESE